MLKNDFLVELESTAPAHLKNSWFLSNAAELIQSIDDNFSFHSIDEVILLAERIRINSIPDDDIFGIEVKVELSHMGLVASDYLSGIIAHWAAQIREELFETTEPPFKDDIKSAVGWVEATAEADTAHVASAVTEAREEGGRQQAGAHFLMRDIFIPAKKSVKAIWVQPGTLLYNLSRRIETLAAATGFRKHALTIYLLTGLEPILPRVNISVNLGRADLPSGAAEQGENKKPRLRLAKRSLKVEINTADLSPDELKTIYDHYRRELKIRKMKALSPEQTKLYYMVTKKGGPPVKGSKKFWLTVQEEWNSNPSNKAYKSWEGVYQRYKIVKQKMDNLFLK